MTEFRENRFVVGNPARDKYFYGRELDVNMILAQPWNWLCGQRRMGKTSMLFRLEVVARTRGWTPLFFSLAHLKPETANGRTLFAKCATAWKPELAQYGLKPEEFTGSDPEEGFTDLVNRIHEASARDHRVLFLWDEAERLIDVENGDPGFLERLRAALERLQHLSFVIAGTQLLADLFGRTTQCSPFLTAFRWRATGPLDADEAKSLLLAERTGGWAVSPPDDLFAGMVQWSGGHPYVLQEAGLQLEDRVRRRAALPSLEEWQSTVASNHVLREAFKDDYVKLTITQQEVLSRLCRDENSMTLDELARAVHRPLDQIEEATAFLENYGYIRKGARCELRFCFYRKLTLGVDSRADQQKVSRISRSTMFISYSHLDAEWLNRVRSFLSPAITAGAIDDWSDQKIQPGALWRDEIARALENARITLLLISQDFLTSDFIQRVELPALLASAANGSNRVLCLHVRPSTMRGALPEGATQLRLLSGFQALNSPTQPLSEMNDAEAELVRIAAKIVEAAAH